MNKKYTDDPIANAIVGDERWPLEQDGFDKYLTPDLLWAYLKTLLTGTAGKITIAAGVITIDTSYIGQGSITTVGTVTTGTWAAKLQPRVISIITSATPTPNSDTTDLHVITALAAGAAYTNPSGTPTGGQSLWLRIKDDGTSRLLSFGTSYRFSSALAAPVATTLGRTMYMHFTYNSVDSKWDCLSILDNF